MVGVGWAAGEVCRGTGLQVKYVEVLDFFFFFFFLSSMVTEERSSVFHYGMTRG